MLGIYLELTRRAGAAQPELIVWPETASPTALRRDPALLATLTALSGELHAALLIGSIDVLDAPPNRLTNAAFLVTERGIVGRYDKIHLVPFGEYVPLSRLIGFVRGWAEFIADLEPGSRTVVFPGPPAPFGVVTIVSPYQGSSIERNSPSAAAAASRCSPLRARQARPRRASPASS